MTLWIIFTAWLAVMLTIAAKCDRDYTDKL
jgi:hypothetical protein